MTEISWNSLSELAIEKYGSQFEHDGNFPQNLWIGKVNAEGELHVSSDEANVIDIVIVGLEPADEAPSLELYAPPAQVLKNLANNWIKRGNGDENSEPFWNGINLLLKCHKIKNVNILFLNIYPFFMKNIKTESAVLREQTILFIEQFKNIPILVLGTEAQHVLENKKIDVVPLYHPSAPNGIFYRSLINPSIENKVKMANGRMHEK